MLTVLLTGESEEAQAEAETLAGLLGRMGELASWCRFSAAGPDEARRALAAGEAAGVVWLPEDFLARRPETCLRLREAVGPEIGANFGGRDHTTVMHAVRKIAQERKTDADLNHELHVLKQIIIG